MKKIAAAPFLCAICFISTAFVARGQSVPVETGSPIYNGFHAPTQNGSLHYAISAGVRETFGYSQQVGTVTTGDISGNVGFITPSIRMPTTLSYTGGYLATTVPQQPSAFFHDFSIGQAYNTRRWQADVSDSLRYLPETPASGIYGIVGVGTATGTVTAQGALFPYATRIENAANAILSVQLTGKTAASATGSYTIERFPGYSGGIQTNEDTITGGVSHRVNSLQSVGANYLYSDFSYIAVAGTFSSQGASIFYKRQWTRRLEVSLAAGPQFISASSLTGQPSSITYNANVTATYVGSPAHGFGASVSYLRSTNGGSGLTFGATNDTFSGTVSSRVTRSLFVSALGTYSRSSGLQLITAQQINTQSAIGTVQANRAFTRTLSVYVSYTALHQSVQGVYGSGPSPLIGLQQELGFGVTYSPSPVHLGR